MERTVFLLSVVGAALLCGYGVTTAAIFDPSPADYGILQLATLRNNSHNLVVGWRQYGDRLLFRDTVKRGYSFGKIISTEVQYPPKGAQKNETITFILARDQSGGSGYANVTAGGVGLRTVKLRLKSKRSRGLNYLVELYGL